MENLTIEALAADLELADGADPERQKEITRRVKAVIAQFGAPALVAALEAAVPPGATLGELIVYRSPKLTLLYGRIPPRFRSAIHDHTVFACIAQLTGAEVSVVYEPTEDGNGLRVAQSITGNPGDVTTLPPDAIHHIENPTDEVATALHVYGGDFGAVMEDRSLWSHDEHVQSGFSFEKMVQQSALAMKKTGNDEGLRGLVAAMPAIKPMVDAL